MTGKKGKNNKKKSTKDDRGENKRDVASQQRCFAKLLKCKHEIFSSNKGHSAPAGWFLLLIHTECIWLHFKKIVNIQNIKMSSVCVSVLSAEWTFISRQICARHAVLFPSRLWNWWEWEFLHRFQTRSAIKSPAVDLCLLKEHRLFSRLTKTD